MDMETLVRMLREASHDDTQTDSPAPDAGGSPSSTGAESAWIDAAVAAGPELAHLLVLPDDAFLVLAYRYVLGRDPDPSGREHHLRQLASGTPRLEMMRELSRSPEARTPPPNLRGSRVRVANALLHLPGVRLRRIVRGLLCGTERRLAARARWGPVGLSWHLAQSQDREQRRWAALQERIGSQLRAQEGRLADLHEEWGAARRQWLGVQARVRMIELQQEAPAVRNDAGGDTRAISAPAPDLKAQSESSASSALSDFYAVLETSFRGDRETLQRQQAKDYLGYLDAARESAGPGWCLDLGCGPGDWLDVLQDRGFDARGVDMNAAMVLEATQRGLNATQQDALSWLHEFPDACALAITALHLVEHITIEIRLALVAQCARVLKPGGLLILETPNPENIWVATHTFHHDPTHTQPLTPASLEFLVNYHGLETVAVPRLHPYPENARLPETDATASRLNHMTCMGQDFAVIARRPLDS